jgi:hypothetical protein
VVCEQMEALFKVSNLSIDYTPNVLQNKGVPIPLLVLDEAGGISFDSEGSQRTEEVHLRMTAGAMMEIEEEFSGFSVEHSEPEMKTRQQLETNKETGETELVSKRVLTGNMVSVSKAYYGTEALEESGKREPYKTVIKVLSICLKMKPQELADRLVTAHMEMYFVAITCAIQIAQGVDPLVIQRLLESSSDAVDASKEAANAGVKLLTAQNEEVVVEVNKALENVDGHLGKSGSDSGQDN